MPYRVKFISLEEHTVDAFDYDHLFEALKVAKETNIGPDRLHKVAISNDKFDRELIMLLTSCFVYAGIRTSELPEGNMMIMLLRVDADGVEHAVYPVVSTIAPPFMPDQRTRNRAPEDLGPWERSMEATHNSTKPPYDYANNPHKLGVSPHANDPKPKSEPGAGNYS